MVKLDLRAILPGVRQWFRDAWGLPWSLKGPFLGVFSTLAVLFAVLGIVLATTGASDDTAVSGADQRPTRTAARVPTPTPTPTPNATPLPTPSPTPSPPPAAAPVLTALEPESPPPPPPAPARGLTAAEVIDCESGQSDGWDDAFNLKPYGFTPFPAPLKLTTEPVACEALWLTAYDDGYSRGTDDRCSIVSEYVSVSSPEELEFCGLEAPPPPTPSPALHEVAVIALVETALETGELQNGTVSFPFAGLWLVRAETCVATWNGAYWHVYCDYAKLAGCDGLRCGTFINACLWESPLLVASCP